LVFFCRSTFCKHVSQYNSQADRHWCRTHVDTFGFQISNICKHEYKCHHKFNRKRLCGHHSFFYLCDTKRSMVLCWRRSIQNGLLHNTAQVYNKPLLLISFCRWQALPVLLQGSYGPTYVTDTLHQSCLGKAKC